jgi:hypothetical protein
MDARNHKPSYLVAIILLLFPQAAVAQSSPQINKHARIPAEERSTELSTRGLRNAWYERSPRVFPLVDRALRIEDSLTKVSTVIDLADLIWDYDEFYARRLFKTAYDDLTSNNTGSPVSEANKKRLMAALIAKLVNRDYEKGYEIITGVEGADPTVRLLAARALVSSNPTHAAELAEKSLSESTLRNINSLLFDLRLVDGAASDALFVRVLDFALAQPTLDAEVLAKLGTYVFNSPSLPPSRNGYEVAPVGEQFAINLSADRPGVPSDVIRAYLSAAVTALARPTSDPRQQQLYYITGYQLLPRVRQLLPSKEQEIIESLRTLSGTVPSVLTQKSTYDSLLADSYRLRIDVSLSAIDKIADETSRDVMCVGIAHAFSEEKKFGEALTIAARIKNAGARAELINLIRFSRAAHLLNRGEISKARLEADTLSQGVARSVLWLGIAGKLAESADKDAAAELVNKALNDARKVADPRSPLLLIAASSIMARVGSPYASQALQAMFEGVQALNQQEKGRQSPVTWSEQVKAGKVTREFSLTVEGIPLRLKEALPPLLAYDYDGTLSNVMTIKNEQLLGQALVSIAHATLGTTGNWSRSKK